MGSRGHGPPPLLDGDRDARAHRYTPRKLERALHEQEKVMGLDDVPHGECVDCGSTTYLWCQKVDNWHCTSCDTDCP